MGPACCRTNVVRHNNDIQQAGKRGARLHVLLQLAMALQVVDVPLDGHVVQAQQVAELDAKSLAQLHPV